MTRATYEDPGPFSNQQGEPRRCRSRARFGDLGPCRQGENPVCRFGKERGAHPGGQRHRIMADKQRQDRSASTASPLFLSLWVPEARANRRPTAPSPKRFLECQQSRPPANRLAN